MNTSLELARKFLNLGLFLSSLLTLRVVGFTLGDLSLFISAGLLLLSGYDRTGKLPVRSSAWIAMGLIIAGGAAATLRADSVSGTVLTVARLLYLIGVLPWQFRRLAPSGHNFRHAVISWGLGATVCGFGTVIQYVLGPNSIPNTTITEAGRFPGFTQHVSDTGGICSAGLVLFLAIMLSKQQQRVALVGLLGCGIGVLLSGSVSGLLAISLATLFLLLRRQFTLARLILAVLGVVVVLDIVGIVQSNTQNALNPIQRIEQVLGQSPSDTQIGLNTTASRLDTDRRGLDGFFENPVFGRGLDVQSGIVDPYANLSPHNVIISAMYGGGLLVGIGLVIPLLGSLRETFRMRTDDQVAMQVSSAYIGALAFAMTAPSTFNRYLWIPATLVLVHADLRQRD